MLFCSWSPFDSELPPRYFQVFLLFLRAVFPPSPILKVTTPYIFVKEFLRFLLEPFKRLQTVSLFFLFFRCVVVIESVPSDFFLLFDYFGVVYPRKLLFMSVLPGFCFLNNLFFLILCIFLFFIKDILNIRSSTSRSSHPLSFLPSSFIPASSVARLVFSWLLIFLCRSETLSADFFLNVNNFISPAGFAFTSCFWF